MTTKITRNVLGIAVVMQTNMAPLSVGSPQLISGSVLETHYGTASIPTAALKDVSLTTAKYIDRSVTGIKIALNGVINENMATGSVDGRVLADGSASTAKYIDRSVTGIKIALNGVINENMATGSVDGRVLATGIINTTHYANNSITPIKLANGTAGDLVVAGAGGVFSYLAKGSENSVLAIRNNVPTWTSSILATGQVVDYIAATAPSGWVMCNGRTIGNASSGATERANADCYSLFVLLWNNYNNTLMPVSGGRGANADADWNANKTITLPDLRGRVTVGLDNMNHSSANRITSASASPNGTTAGAFGGSETVTLTENNIPAHSHLAAEYPGSGNVSGSGTAIANSSDVIWSGYDNNTESAYRLRRGPSSNPNTGRTSTYGAGQAFVNMPPFFVIYKIIKL